LTSRIVAYSALGVVFSPDESVTPVTMLVK